MKPKDLEPEHGCRRVFDSCLRQWDADRQDWEFVEFTTLPPGPISPPATIKMGHITWHLTFVPAAELPTEQAVYGCTDCTRLIIFVQQALPKLLQVDVVIHECLHAIYFSYGIRKKLREEEACSVLSGPLVALMRDNPQLVAWTQSL